MCIRDRLYIYVRPGWGWEETEPCRRRSWMKTDAHVRLSVACTRHDTSSHRWRWSATHTPCMLTVKTLHIPRLLVPHRPSRVPRSSSSSNLLQVHHFRFSLFPRSCPTIWNSLPDSIRSSDTFISFRRHLKSHLFQAALRPYFLPENSSASDLFVTNGALKMFYLLTYLL